LFDPETLATPLEKLIDVEEPKLVVEPKKLETVGLFEPIVAAPPNVRLLVLE
jgi:hypothetical protein